MFQIRPEERDYALLKDPETAERNRYGKAIDLTAESNQPQGVSLRINGDETVGDNPNRYKQHGFHFTADNCIGCHACEAACSEKNDLPPHLSFRSVGYVEGGSYPAYTRMNISMACNHCDDPACLKGCPTRAYTKHAEYGAVIQDPNICFGCGYCTWVCPYNAPQLDPVAGQVEKCNMCVDRLEVGLKPACASACLGGALNFGVVENLPDARDQTRTEIPGFPSPDITHPNIRFQQTRSLPRELTRTDSNPVKYRRIDGTTVYEPAVHGKGGTERQWGVAKLSSRENPLVVFTLATQAVIGSFALLFIGTVLGIGELTALAASDVYLPMLAVLIGLQVFVLYLSTQHLGKPIRFYRGFNNWRHSPVSREALGVSAFLALLGGHAVLSLFDHGIAGLFGAGAVAGLIPWLPTGLTAFLAKLSGGFAVIAGVVGLWFMHRIYRIKARPYWDHWQVLASFFGSMLTLGALLTGLMAVPVSIIALGFDVMGLLALLAGPLMLGMLIEGIGHVFHARDLMRRGGEGAAAHHKQTTAFGLIYWARNGALAANIALVLGLGLLAPTGWMGLAAWAAVAVLIMTTSLVGRALFYVLVIPTTMPGAFFWRNPAFQEHARETGLAEMPQVGVVPDAH